MANQKFADHVTSLAFNLSLSKNMIICLVAIANKSAPLVAGDTMRLVGGFDTTVPTRHRLTERGLIYIPEGGIGHDYTLTSAGECVLQLLEHAGIVQKVNDILEAA